MRFAALAGRVLVGLVFLLPGLMKARDWYSSRQSVVLYDLPMPEVTLPVLVGIEIVAGLAMILGLRTRLAALLLMIHVGFWSFMEMDLVGATNVLLIEHADRFLQQAALFGALLFMFGMGGGPYRLSRR